MASGHVSWERSTGGTTGAPRAEPNHGSWQEGTDPWGGSPSRNRGPGPGFQASARPPAGSANQQRTDAAPEATPRADPEPGAAQASGHGGAPTGSTVQHETAGGTTPATAPVGEGLSQAAAAAGDGTDGSDGGVLLLDFAAAFDSVARHAFAPVAPERLQPPPTRPPVFANWSEGEVEGGANNPASDRTGPDAEACLEVESRAGTGEEPATAIDDEGTAPGHPPPSVRHQDIRRLRRPPDGAGPVSQPEGTPGGTEPDGVGARPSTADRTGGGSLPGCGPTEGSQAEGAAPAMVGASRTEQDGGGGPPGQDGRITGAGTEVVSSSPEGSEDDDSAVMMEIRAIGLNALRRASEI